MLKTLFETLSMLFGNTVAIITAVICFTIFFIVVVYVVGQIFVIKEHLQNIDKTNKEILEELKNKNN